ncbi:MAG: hypothetical protein LQ349_001683 [Xanthoria aureola]|nr:MAG: hypothetical protein LQ349_001683 [Xanthoria aureola]
MLLRWLWSWLFIAPLLIHALSIIKPRADGDEQDNEICLAYDTCSKKGLGYWNTLHTTLYKAQLGLTVDRNDSALFNTHYITEYRDSDPLDPDLQQSLQNRNVDPTTEMDTWQSSGLHPSTHQRDQWPAYYNIFDTHNGYIIADSNRRAGDSQQALPWSELIYQTWQLAAQKATQLATHGKTQHPQAAPSRISAAWAAYEAKGWQPGYDGAEQWRKFTEEEDGGEKDFFFYGLLGTENVRGTVWLLRDHANEIGRKDVEAIWVRWYMGNPDIWIDISPSQWSA